MHSSFSGASSVAHAPPAAASPPGSAASGGGALASSLSLLSGHDTQHKIKELLPGDTAQRTELLLSLLKSSYSSSLHSADVRMAALTQEVVALRAQQAYGESKLRSVEALAEEAGRAADEQRKRSEQLLQENVRLKAENQALKAENTQLAHFKSLLVSAANGMAPAHSPLQLALAAPYPNAQATQYSSGNATTTHTYSQHSSHQQQQQPPHSSDPAELDYKHSTASASTLHAPPAAAPSSSSHDFFFSPVKSTLRPHDSISVGHHAHHDSAPHATPQPSYPRSSSSYVHVMPSPLSADALASPAPTMQHRRTSTVAAASSSAAPDDLLSEINAHLSSSRMRSPSPMPAATQGYSSGTAHAHAIAASASPAPSSASASSSSPNLVDQARALFQTAQSRLPSGAFGEFVSLVQQFRQASHSSSSSGVGWEAIRARAATLLAPWQDILAQFDMLLHATQMQQQHR